jgi:hypothetical protein
VRRLKSFTMDAKKLFQKLRGWIKVIQTSFLMLKLVEVVAIIFIGIATSEATSNSPASGIWIGILITAGLTYLVISILQTAYNYYFPSNFANELEARFEIEDIRKKLSRKAEMYEYLTQSISSLNNETCHIMGGSNEHLCDTGIKENLTNVVAPLFKNTNYIFQCNKNSYTIGLYLHHYLQQPANLHPPIPIIYDSGLIILRDDFDLKHDIDKYLLDDISASGFRQQVKQLIEKSFTNVSYVYETVKSFSKDYSLFATPIQEVCPNTSPRGVLFIVGEKICAPEDIDQILKIFSAIISNLLSRQDECIFNRITHLNQQHSWGNIPVGGEKTKS